MSTTTHESTPQQSIAADVNLSPEALTLFLALARDAGNWSGTPLFGGNVGGSPESKGHLTKLKRARLVTTFVDYDDRSLSWVQFTAAGRALAAQHGVELS